MQQSHIRADVIFPTRRALTWSELPDTSTFIKFDASPSLPSSVPVACRPHDRLDTNRSCAAMVRIHRPVLISHIRIERSSDAERRYFPLGWKTRDRTQSSCPSYAPTRQ